MQLLEMTLAFGSNFADIEQQKEQEKIFFNKGWLLVQTQTTTSNDTLESEYPCVTTMTFAKNN